jgi:cell division inhibitor SulA
MRRRSHVPSTKVREIAAIDPRSSDEASVRGLHQGQQSIRTA